ncbi:hypothetical protein M440DRAFT_1126223 [Trichoderma longibrachiatum ATCC 18648]|uniref:Uncharacterized protein n=1 Tax=Trichoderma longibrachiatum ATCC 18648 TaxID=983965 RepID=A0A2T4CFW1_TRILO|nr:hypothetical protein M440DRAFT_1126223 [Trichoderma longibrachiatum ATCC 18648]
MKTGGVGWRTQTHTRTHTGTHTTKGRGNRKEEKNKKGVSSTPRGRRRVAIGATIWGAKGDLECSALQILPWTCFGAAVCLAWFGGSLARCETVCCRTSTGCDDDWHHGRGRAAAPGEAKGKRFAKQHLETKHPQPTIANKPGGYTRLRLRRRHSGGLVTSYRPCSWLQQAVLPAPILLHVLFALCVLPFGLPNAQLSGSGSSSASPRE